MPSHAVDIAIVLAAVLTGAVLASCSGPSVLDSADAGRTVRYEPGLPNFDLEAIATWREGTPGVDVYLGIPYVSLVYVHAGGVYTAPFELVVRVLDRRSRDLVEETAREDTIRVTDYEATQSYEARILRERLEVPPGSYVVEVALTDGESDKTVVRRQAVDVVGPGAGEPHISRMRLEARHDTGGFEPLVALHIPSGLDSLRSVVELYNLAAREDVAVELRLLRFPSDTTVAAPPYWLSPSHGSLAYRGVRYDRPDTLQVSRRRLQNVDREAVVEFMLPELDDGIYRVEVVARLPEAAGEPVVLERVRDLSVKSPGFPHVELLDDLVSALAYIAYENEIEAIEAGTTPPERKRRFDAFWGSLVPNRQVAANLIRLYYSRVEEANLFFTSFKEGWKTDRGMIYIILGPPTYVDNRIDSEVWHYSYGDRDPVRTFVFERVMALGGDQPFDNYVLQRRPYYQQMWSQAVDRWREGVVL